MTYIKSAPKAITGYPIGTKVQVLWEHSSFEGCTLVVCEVIASKHLLVLETDCLGEE